MTWETLAELFDIDTEEVIEKARLEEEALKAEGKRKKVFPEDVLVYEVAETYPEWTRIRKIIPIICKLDKGGFAYASRFARSPLAKLLLFKMRADCADKGAAAILEEFLYGNPLTKGTEIQRYGFIKYWINGEGEKEAIEYLTVIGYPEEEATEIVEKMKPKKKEKQVGIPEKPPKVEEVEKPLEKTPPTKAEILSDIKKRMEKFK